MGVQWTGAPYITGSPVKPGEVYAYELTVPVGNAGSHTYHSHHNAAKQVGLELLGAFIVEARQARTIEKVDLEYTTRMFGMVTALVVGKQGRPAKLS